ncbi:MAG: HAMP domain-containing histidine kinase [Drouetiella hepatica Uher 2000/2452]|jgi:signal transduction histidine kinase|uniref:histidine kinase n=1 Tax=Drouetiella hepatica Uher 2000/2452 TaxID=904376 RepID=A0A951QES3_9CYAN|nr:HAMP domain-containing histidine kinase [Drouetiella hepatica Uher 2000/2452]
MDIGGKRSSVKPLKAQSRSLAENLVSKRAPSPPGIPSSGIGSFDRGYQHIFGETRTRILQWYLLILGLIFLLGIPAFRYLLFQRVDERVRQNMVEEMETFRELVAQGQSFPQNPEKYDPEDLERLKESFPIETRHMIPPASEEELEEFFEQYLRYRVPVDDTFFITFMDGKFFKSSPRGRPQILSRDSTLMQDWGSQTRPSQGVAETKGFETGAILYMLEPVQMHGQTRGVLVIAHTTAGERAEILEAVVVIIQVSLALFAISLVLTWLAAGHVLAPLRIMTVTAQTISETDLSKRLPVQGSGELAEMAATFNSMMDRLETAFDTQREFVNDAGHELRTPITIIQGNLELMGNDPDEQRATLSLVMGELDRMSRMVNDMIVLAKAERSDFLHLTVVNAAELTKELFTKAKALAGRDWQLDETARGQIVVDRERITEALMNLAQNAAQHTQAKDTIAIGSTIAKGKVRFWVRDTGEGIPLPDQKRIFDRFTRAANSRQRLEGCGLGLSIVKAIAEAHSGQVLLRSKLGSGSMFTLVLPLDPPQEAVVHVAYPHRRR